MRVHVTRVDILRGRETLGDFEVVAETPNWYKLNYHGVLVSQEWVPKVNCEVVKVVARDIIEEYLLARRR